MKHKNITGALICGGKSTRFGSDKRLYRYRGKTFFEIAYEKLANVCDDVVCVFRDEVPDSVRSYSIIYDDSRFEGPMAGILAALNHTEQSAILTLPCDVPLITENFLSYLASLKGEGKVVVPFVDGFEPLIALYPTSIEPLMRTYARTDVSLYRFIESLGDEEKMVVAPFSKAHFENVNYFPSAL